MNKIYFLMLFICMNLFSMAPVENFILTNDGTKIIIRHNSFRIDIREKMVFYKLSNVNIESKIRFKDFDYILLGTNKFKTYQLNNSKEVNGYFVLSETDSRTLIFTTKPNEDVESTKVNYVFYIVDSNNAIVDGLEFDNLKNTKSSNTRGEIFSKIRFYFNDCEKLVTRITSYDNLLLENQNMDILDFFNLPVYIECIKEKSLQ
jgi:hypothetical protein